MRWLSVVCACAALPLALTACEGAPSPRYAVHGARAPRTTDDLQEIGCSTTRPVRSAPPEFDDADPSAIRLFYDVLASYGTWSDDGRLGIVWSPAHEEVGDEFVPYATHGRWTHRAWSSPDSRNGEPPIDEYVWVSDLAWGWVTFHFGRWTYAGDLGWSWVPGRRYAGAWVDWRLPENGSSANAVVGWGPTPPSELWRLAPGPAPRTRAGGLDVREARFEVVSYSAFATPYAYARTKDFFAPDLGARLLYGPAALAVASGTVPGPPPRLEQLGLLGQRHARVPAPPALDRGLQQAWMLATPAAASAVGAGPELSEPPREKSYVTGGPQYYTAETTARGR